MVIGYDGSRAFIKDKTGTENYSYQLLKNLALIDHQNSYLVFLRPGSDKLAQTGGFSWPDNFEFITINYPRLWTQIGLSLATFKQKLDILFVPAHTLPLIVAPGVKKIVTVHDLGAQYLPNLHQLKQVLYLGWITKHQLNSADKIISVSEATKSDLVKRANISASKVQVIYEGVDQNIFKKFKKDSLVDTLNQFDIDYKKYFLFVGTIQPRKNLERLIQAFSQLEGDSSAYKLVLAGQKGWKSDEIYELPKKLKITERVKFLGRVEDKDLVSLYNGSIGLVYPSLFEGFGLPIIEAFATKTPVLTSNISSMKEIAGEAAILVDPTKVEDISLGLEKLLNSALTDKIVARGEIRLKDFSWEKTAQNTLKLFEETINE